MQILLDRPTPQSYQEPTAATGSPRDTVNGFRPLFRPSNNYDPSVYTADAIRNSLPPGFKFSSASSVMTPNSYPALSAPAVEFTSPTLEFDDITEQSVAQNAWSGNREAIIR